MEFAACIADMATAVMFAAQVGQMVVSLLQAHFNNLRQAGLLAQEVGVVNSLLKRLRPELDRRCDKARQESVVLAVEAAGRALRVSGAQQGPCDRGLASNSSR